MTISGLPNVLSDPSGTFKDEALTFDFIQLLGQLLFQLQKKNRVKLVGFGH